MGRRETMALLIVFGVSALGCSTVRGTPATERNPEPSIPATIDTAPPPILYPPHDPAATYPVIRTWAQVLTFEPYGYLKALPAAQSTDIDGVYGKLDPSPPQWWRCARCPDFKLAGGIWRLMLHQGTLRMYYDVTGFSTVSSYTLSDDRLELFNDPHCPYETGEYTWSLKDHQLSLVEIQDACAIHLRAENLTHQPWTSCQPPNAEAGATDHWIHPSFCQ